MCVRANTVRTVASVSFQCARDILYVGCDIRYWILDIRYYLYKMYIDVNVDVDVWTCKGECANMLHRDVMTNT